MGVVLLRSIFSLFMWWTDRSLEQKKQSAIMVLCVKKLNIWVVEDYRVGQICNAVQKIRLAFMSHRNWCDKVKIFCTVHRILYSACSSLRSPRKYFWSAWSREWWSYSPTSRPLGISTNAHHGNWNRAADFAVSNKWTCAWHCELAVILQHHTVLFSVDSRSTIPSCTFNYSQIHPHRYMYVIHTGS